MHHDIKPNSSLPKLVTTQSTNQLIYRKPKLSVQLPPEEDIKLNTPNKTLKNDSYKLKSSSSFLHTPTRYNNLAREISEFPKPKQVAIEILKGLNFSLNPQLHKRKKINNMKKNNFSSIQFDHVQPSAIARNILELRDRSRHSFIASVSKKPQLKKTKIFKNGTLSLLQNTNEARTYISQKEKGFIQTSKPIFTEKQRDKLRLQCVKWLLEYHQDVVQILNDKKEDILKAVNYVGDINRQEFDLIMKQIGLSQKDYNFLQRLFWLFDLNGDEQIDSNEIQYSVNLFKEYTIEEKINMFFDLCDENEDQYIDAEEIKRFFSKNLTNEEEYRTAKQLSKDFLRELNPKNIENGLTKEELYQATLTNPNVKLIVDKNTRILKSTKPEDFIKPSQYIIKRQDQNNGIFFPYLDNLFHAIEDKEKLREEHNLLKNDNYKKKQNANYLENSDDEDKSSDEQIN